MAKRWLIPELCHRFGFGFAFRRRWNFGLETTCSLWLCFKYVTISHKPTWRYHHFVPKRAQCLWPIWRWYSCNSFDNKVTFISQRQLTNKHRPLPMFIRCIATSLHLTWNFTITSKQKPSKRHKMQYIQWSNMGINTAWYTYFWAVSPTLR